MWPRSRMGGGLIDWLVDWSFGRLVLRLIGWLVDWSIGWLVDWLIGWLVSHPWWLNRCICFVTSRHVSWTLFYRETHSFCHEKKFLNMKKTTLHDFLLELLKNTSQEDIHEHDVLGDLNECSLGCLTGLSVSWPQDFWTRWTRQLIFPKQPTQQTGPTEWTERVEVTSKTKHTSALAGLLQSTFLRVNFSNVIFFLRTFPDNDTSTMAEWVIFLFIKKIFLALFSPLHSWLLSFRGHFFFLLGALRRLVVSRLCVYVYWTYRQKRTEWVRATKLERVNRKTQSCLWDSTRMERKIVLKLHSDFFV